MCLRSPTLRSVISSAQPLCSPCPFAAVRVLSACGRKTLAGLLDILITTLSAPLQSLRKACVQVSSTSQALASLWKVLQEPSLPSRKPKFLGSSCRPHSLGPQLLPSLLLWTAMLPLTVSRTCQAPRPQTFACAHVTRSLQLSTFDRILLLRAPPTPSCLSLFSYMPLTIWYILGMCIWMCAHVYLLPVTPNQNRNSSGHQFLAWLVTVPCPLSRCTPGRQDGCSVERPVRWVSTDMNESWHIFDFIGYKTTIPSRVTFILGTKIHPKVASGSVGYSRQMCFLLKG